MSKLTIVRQALETNPDVTIVNVDERDEYGYFSHMVDFWVAPRNGLYTSDELQVFMMRLVPDLEPTLKDNFIQYSDALKTLRIGKLYFDEKVDEDKVAGISTSTDERLLNVFEFVRFVNGERTIVEAGDYSRRTLVRPFPNEAYTRDVLDGKLSDYWTNLRDLERYQPNLIQRIFGRK